MELESIKSTKYDSLRKDSLLLLNFNMSFLRQYIAPLLTVLIFLIALVAVSARSFLPSDLSAPAPITDQSTMVNSKG